MKPEEVCAVGRAVCSWTICSSLYICLRDGENIEGQFVGCSVTMSHLCFPVVLLTRILFVLYLYPHTQKGSFTPHLGRCFKYHCLSRSHFAWLNLMLSWLASTTEHACRILDINTLSTAAHSSHTFQPPAV